MNKVKALNRLKVDVEACQRCSLRQGCQQVVLGEGNPEAGLLLVGEAPGLEEDRKGRPFVGRAGQLLDKLLQDSGLDRCSHTYIVNLVKCRPPQNRVPSRQEIAHCRGYLAREVEIIKPEIVVLLGATAFRTFIDPRGKITISRGQWLDGQEQWTIATYHPAALLRNPKLIDITLKDFKEVARKYREVKGSEA